MRRYGLYDATRGLTTAVAAGIAGVLLWLATQVGVGSVTSFWESMALVAAAGLVFALSQVVGGWTKGGRLRVSPTTFLLAFVPVLVCAGWILMATQPGNGWHEGTIASWSRSIGLFGLVHALGLWHGVLAFGIGLTLGLSLDTVPARIFEPAAETATATRREQVRDVPADDERAVANDRGPFWRRRSARQGADEEAPADDRRAGWRRRPTTERDADEPLQAERESAQTGTRTREPGTVTVGPRTGRAEDDEA